MASTRWHFAACPAGLEEILAAEVRAWEPAELRVERGGVLFRAIIRTGYAVALWSRVATRVLQELERGRLRRADDVYDIARRVRWERHLAPGQSFAIDAIARSPLFRQPHYAALKVKDALVDHLREQRGSRPDVDTRQPDVRLRVHVRGQAATLSRDLVGNSLHRRGYRPAQHRSPLNEALAAGLLLLSDWDRSSPLCDPMCGSATLLIEAAFLAGDRAPGLRRSYALERWPDADLMAWEALREQAEQRWARGRKKLPPLLGNDRHPGAIALAREAIGRAELEGRIQLAQEEIGDYEPPLPPERVITNPPYGLRLDEPDLEQSWRELGRFVKRHCGGKTAWVLSGNHELSRFLHMRAARKIPVYNGALDCRLLEYEVLPPRPARPAD